ncbi:MAG TPA: type II secretion system F family protein [Mycobacteriales bacterium]|nr:type II secretion system F family protein [Mycobacteriales bacterium]
MLALSALAVLACPAPAAGLASQRLRGLAPAPVGRPRGAAGELVRRHAHRFGPVGVGLAVAMMVGGPVGLVAGVTAGLVSNRLFRRVEPAAVRRALAERSAELSEVLDLLSAALAAGLPASAALSAVAAAAGGPLAADLSRVGQLSALGAGPAAAWQEYLDDPVLGPVARAASRSADSGIALADRFARMASDHRAEGTLRAEAAARRAGVLAMAPLGLCFLPAFICLGVVPVVLGIAAEVLP